MPFREEERDFLITNAARDRAEMLLSQLRELSENAEREAATRADLSDEQRAQGQFAMEQAIAATERMLANLNEAMAIAEQAVRAGGWEELGALEGGEQPAVQEIEGIRGADDDDPEGDLDHFDDDDDDFVDDDDAK